MGRRDDSGIRTRVITLIARLDDKVSTKLPASLTSDVKVFRAAVMPFLAVAEKAEAALAVRDDAHEAIGDADALLDASLDDLANALVGEKMGKRSNPFKDFSEHAPSQLRELAYKKEVLAAEKLVAAIAKKRPAAKIKAAMAKVTKHVAEVKKRLDALTGPEAVYQKARGARDNLLAVVSKALGRLRLRAKAGLVDEPEAYAALFAPRAAVQAPRATRKKPKETAINGEAKAEG